MNHPSLFDLPPDMPLKGAGHRRNAIGLLVEELLCHATGWTHLPKGRQGPHCPDAETRKGVPIEIKSVHCSGDGVRGKAVVYASRLAKDAEHAPNLLYAFFCHHSTGEGKSKSTATVLDRFAADVLWLVVVPAAKVREWAALCKLCKPKRAIGGKRAGYNRPGYGDGYYNLPVERLLQETDSVKVTRFEKWGRGFVMVISYPKECTRLL